MSHKSIGTSHDDFDACALDQIRSIGRPALLNNVIEIFLASTRPRIEQIKTAADRFDIDTIRFEAHTVKSSAATVGGAGLSSLCATIESLAASGAGMEEISTLAGSVEVSFEQLETQLQSWLPESATQS